MPVKSFRPTTPTRRFQTVVSREDITKQTPEKSLVKGKPATRRTQQHGTHFVALPSAADTRRPIARSISSATSTGSWRWSRRSNTIRTAARASRCCTMWTARSATFWRRSASKSAATITSGPEADILVGNSLPLKNIPAGTIVHNIELKPGKGGQMARSAGAQAQLVSKEGEHGAAEAAVGRNPQGAGRIARRPSARWATSSTKTSAWAKPDASAGWARCRTIAACR